MAPPHDRAPFRALEVPPAGNGLRLDRFLALRFPDRTRSAFARGIRDGLVTDDAGKPLRASTTVWAGQVLRLYLPGIAPATPPPPLPPILWEDDRLVVLDKPAGLACHPGGTAFVWAVVGLARERWPRVDLVHRLDRDTSGVLVLSKEPSANAWLKAEFKAGRVHKEYEALVRGEPAWDHRVIDDPIGPAGGVIRIQMACRPDGLPAHTEVTVLGRANGLGRVRCRIGTGRTHQIRVHLAQVGHGVLGDRMYGVPPEVFLDVWEHGVGLATMTASGAPRQALHARRIAFTHPGGGTIEVEAPVPADMERWWATPEVLPLDGSTGEAAPEADDAAGDED